MKDPLEAAGMATTVAKARALDARLLRDLEEGWESMSVEEIAEHEQARRELSEQFKTVAAEKGATVTRTGRAQERQVREHVTARQKEARQKVREARAPSKPKPAPTRRARPAAGRRRSSSGGLFARRGRYLEETGLPEASRTTTSLVLQLLGVVLAVSFMYVILRNAQRAPRGNSAIEVLSKAVVGALRRVIDPVDPLGAGNAHGPSTQGDRARSPRAQRNGRGRRDNIDAIIDGVTRGSRDVARARTRRRRRPSPWDRAIEQAPNVGGIGPGGGGGLYPGVPDPGDLVPGDF